MKKRIIAYLFILTVVFIYGVVVGTTKIPPYNQIKNLKIFFIGENRVSSSLYYYKKRLAESLYIYDYKIVMLGDSITDHADWNKLAKRTDILNRGISGDNTDGLLWKLNSLPEKISKAFIMIGVNDFGKGSSVEYIFNNYTRIIDILIEKKITPIIQSTLYVGSSVRNRKNSDIKKLNIYLTNYSKKNNLIFIDLNQIIAPKGILSSSYSSDGIHLNQEAYNKWIKEIKKYF